MKTVTLQGLLKKNHFFPGLFRRSQEHAAIFINSLPGITLSGKLLAARLAGIVLLFMFVAGTVSGQTATVYLQNTQTQSGTGSYVRDLATAIGSSGTVTSQSISSSFTEALSFTIDISNLASVIAGTQFSVSVSVNNISSNASARFRIQHVNTTGTVLDNTGYSTSFSTNGTKTANLSFLSYQTWASTDRLKLSVELSRTGGGGGRTIVVNTGNSNSTIQYTTCATFSLTGTSATSPICASTGTSTVTLASAAANLPVGTYTVTYNRSNPSATDLTASMTVTTAGSGTFTASGLTSPGSSTVTVTNLESGVCSTAISANNVSNSITINSSPAAAGSISGSATVYPGQTGVTYSVPEISGATSYLWNYSGTGATITGTTNSITVDFSSSATSGNLTVQGTGSGCSGTVSSAFAISVSSYSSSGTYTFTVPAGIYCIQVEAWGGGGRGGNTSGDGAAGGGGGGAYSRSIVTVTPGSSYTVNIGQGSSSTSAGGDTWFSPGTVSNALALAKGGSSVNTSTQGGAGGAASGGVGDVKFDGGNGANAYFGTGTDYGGGGGSSAGTDAMGNYTNTTTQGSTGATAPTGGGSGGNGRYSSDGNGTTGSGPGGGGGGAVRNGGTNFFGGDGADGKVSISWVGLTSSAEPVVSAPACAGETSASGTSTEADGAVIEVFVNGTTQGTTIVTGNAWTKTGLTTLVAGDKITAKAKAPGKCQSAASNEITVSAAPVPSFTTAPGVNSCIGSDVAYTTEPGQSNYTWILPGTLNTDYSISSGGTGTTSNTLTVKWLTAGSKTVTVNYSDVTGCYGVSAASSTTNVNTLPTATISYSGSPLCYTSGTKGIVTITGTTGGTFSSDPAGIVFDANGDINLNSASPTGSYTVYYTFSNGTCSNTVSTNVRITTKNTTGATAGVQGGNTTPCEGAVITLTATNDPEYTYSWSGPGLSSTDREPQVTVPSSAGTPVIYNVTITAACSFTTIPVTITPSLAPVPVITGDTAVCVNSTVTYHTDAGKSNYNWTVSSGGVITDGGNSTDDFVTVNWNTLGSESVSVNYFANGCEGAIATVMTVDVLTVPDQPTISGPATPCQGSSGQVYSVTSDPYSTYAWSYSGTGATIDSGAGTSSISVSYSTSATSGTWTVTPTNMCGPGTAATSGITISPLPAAAGTITGTSTVCQGSTGISFSTGSITNATSYTWTYSGTGASISGTTASITINFAANATSGTLSVTGTNSCGNGEASTFDITVSAGVPAAAGSIIGPASPVCAGTSLTYHVDPVAGALNYSWTLPTGWSITSGDGTASITVTSGSAAQNGNISVITSNGCGSQSGSTQTIQINPTAATNNTGYVSSGGNLNDGQIRVGRGSSTYRGYLKFLLSSIPGNATISTAVLKLTNTGSTSVSDVSTVMGIGNNDPTSTTGSALYTAIGNGTSYSSAVWSSTGTISLTLNSSAISDISNRASSPGYLALGLMRGGSNNSSYYFYGYNGTTVPELEITYTAPLTTTLAVTVDPTVITLSPATAANYCLNEIAPAPLTISSTGTITGYQWYSNTIASNTGGSEISGAMSSSYTPLTTTAGTLYYYCVVSDNQSCNITSSISNSVTINSPILSNTISSGQTICAQSTAGTLTGSLPAGGNGTSYGYLWQSNTASETSEFAAATGTSNTQNYITPSLTQTTWYRRVVTSGGCSDTSSVIRILVNPLPTAITVTGGGQVCDSAVLVASNGNSGTIYFQGTTSGGTSTSDPSTTKVIKIAGTYYFRALSADGCWGVETSEVITEVNTPPVTTNASICAGGSGSLTATAACAAGSSISTGATNATSGASSGSGTAWTNTGSIVSDGNGNASVSINAGATSQNLLATGYGFSLPSDASIIGVSVAINRWGSFNGLGAGIQDVSIRLLKAGAATGDNKAVSGLWVTSNSTVVTYGGLSDTWGSSWSGSDINASNFGVILSVSNTGTMIPISANVDYVQVTVTYALPGSINWYTASSGGTLAGTGTSFDPVGKAGGPANSSSVGTYTYYAVCSTSTLGTCRTAATFTINAVPDAPTVTGETICENYSATLRASGATTGDQYKWYDAATGGTLEKTSTNNSDSTYTTPSLTATKNYWVSVISDHGCEGQRTLVTATVQPAPSLSVSDVTVNESAGTADFTVSLSTTAVCDVTFDASTANVTATAGSDYTALISAPYTITAGNTSVTVSVPVSDDNLTEPSETFHLDISNAVNATISDGTGTGTITDNDASSVSIGDVTVNESDGSAVFTVTLTGAIQDALSVDYTTGDITAVAGSDFTVATGTVTFPAGSSDGATETISVDIADDGLTEPTETFSVALSNPVSTGTATIGTGTGTGTILDNDASSVAIGDVTVSESAGTASFTVTLTGSIQDALTVDYTTGDVTALSGSDYTSESGTVTFPAGSSDGATQTITIPILGDVITEPTETFTVTLSNALSTGSASITTGTGTGTITDDDASSVAIDNVTVSESDGNAMFTVTLTGAIQDALTVSYTTADVSAEAGSDYTSESGTVTFPAGSADGATRAITVAVSDDAVTEATETFDVNLSNILGGGDVTISDGTGTGTITDNDASSVSIGDVTVNESDGSAVFTVTLTGAIQDALSVDYTTGDITAVAGSDFTVATGTVTFPAGSSDGATETISVDIADDGLTEPTETFSVALSNPVSTGTATIGTGTGTGTILDNDASSVAIGDVTVSESAGTASFTVTLTGSIQDALTVDYTTGDVTALSGSDYTSESGTVTFPAGSSDGATQTITIPILGDVITEPTETFTVTLSNALSTGSASITTGTGTGTITDDDASSVAIDNVTVSESDGNAMFTVTLTGAIQDALTVSYTTADVSAEAGSDYTSESGTVTFPAGSADGATRAITVAVSDDAVTEATETFDVNLSNILGGGDVTISDGTGTGTITDNDASSVSIGDVTVNESDGSAVFTVTLTGAIQDALSVDYTTGDITAVAGSDFTVATGTVTFPAGSSDGATETISVDIADDGLTEPTETFSVALSNPVSTGTATIGTGTGTGTILDNDASSVAIGDVTVSESAGTASFTVTLTGSIQDALTVDYTTGDVTALSGSDYTSESGTVTFPAGSSDGATQTITIPILGDVITEPTETFTVTLSNALSTGSASITTGTGTGTITDDDASSVAIDNVTVSESDGNAMFTVTLTGAIQDALTVSYTTADVSAEAGSDYTSESGTVTFPAGSADGATRAITVAVSDDAVTEATETFDVNLSNILGGGDVTISDGTGTGTITDNDASSVSIGDVTVNESDGSAVFTVTLTGAIQDALSVDYTTGDITAVAGSDFTVATGTVTFPAGSSDGATETISVDIADDGLTEPTETFSVALSNPVSTGTATIGTGTGTGTILDNDASSVAIGDVTVSESAGTASFTVTLTGSIQDALTVDYTTGDVTALSGSDYTSESGTVTFPAGSSDGATQTITIPILGDVITEPTETFTVTLSNALSTGSASITTGTGTGTITDDDASSVAIDNVTVSESDGNAMFTVTLTGAIQDALTVSYTTADVSAEAGSDYTSESGTVTFPAGSADGATRAITVAVSDDAVTEATETFDVNLSNILGGGDVTISDGTGTGTITDNDASSVSIGDVTVNESDGSAVFTVTLTGAIQDALSVDYTTGDITAVAGSDFTVATGTVTFPAGSSDGATETISVDIADDGLTEPTETFSVALSNPVSTGTATIGTGTGTGTILDNDASSVAIGDVTVSESAGTASFTVTLTGSIQDALTVDYTTGDVTALSGSDYTSESGTVTFPAGSSDGATQTITIPILGDVITEPTETFTVTLSNALSTGSASITTGTGTGTITDDDAVTISVADVSVNENGGNAVFNVTISGQVQNPVTVNYSTSDGTALQPGDYTSESGTLTFGGTNPLTQTISVPVINDLTIEPDEIFTVSLSGLSDGNQAVTISDAQATGTIHSDDVASITCPGPITQNTDPGICTAAVSIPTQVFNTNWPTAVLSWTMTGATATLGTGQIGTFTFNRGVTTITYLVSDLISTNTATCDFTVTVTDGEDPALTCQPSAPRFVDVGHTTYTVVGTEFDATATDNCGMSSLTYALSGATTGSGTSLAGVALNIGINTVVWTANDINGRHSTCTTTITVNTRATTVVYSGDVTAAYSDAATLTATLTDNSTSSPLPGRTITFTIGTQSVVATTNASGIASATLVLTQAPGNYSVQSAFAGDGTYDNSSDSDPFTITAKHVTVSATAGQSKIYGDPDPVFAYTVSPALYGSDTFAGALTRVAGQNVGTYAIQIGTLANSNYAITFVTSNFTIVSRALTVTADPQTKVYGTSDPVLTYEITSGSLAGSDVFTGNIARDPGENVGDYTIRQGTLALSTNYALTFIESTLSITGRPITVAADPKTKIYGDADPVFTYQITSGSLSGTDTFSGSLSRDPGESVGAYHITQGTLTPGPNYLVTYVGADLTITQRAITITADTKTKFYGDPDNLTYQITSGFLATNGDVITGSLTRDPGEDVGVYNITIGTLTLNSNYIVTFIGGTLTIVQRPITVNAVAQTKVYGEPDPVLSYVITSGSLAFSDVFTGSLERTPGEDVGVYAISQATLALTDNYALTFIGDSLHIIRRDITVTADPQTKVYGEADPALTYQITSGSLAGNGDAFTGSLSRDPGENVGEYSIVQGTLALTGNYNLTYIGALLTITRSSVAVTVKADDLGKVYGDPDPELTFQIISGTLVGSDTFTGQLTREAGENVGTYNITQGTLALGINYDLVFQGGTFTITVRPITVTADNKTKPKGTSDPDLTYEITSGSLAANGDAFTGSLTRDAGESVGTYNITQGTLALSSNYDLTFISGTLEITPGFELKGYPNPFSDHLYLEFDLNKDSDVKLEIFNLNGIRLATVFTGNLTQDHYIFDYAPDYLSEGIIIYRLTIDGKTVAVGKAVHKK